MQNIRKSKLIDKRKAKKAVALVCAVCFVAFLLFASLHADHSADANESAGVCQRTSMSVCKCDASVASLQVKNQIHEHNNVHVDCFVCTFIHKTVNQGRQFLTSVSSIAFADVILFTLTALFLLSIVVKMSTPIELKTRTNN